MADRVWICASPVFSTTNHSLIINWFSRDYIAWSLAPYILNLDICLPSTALWDFICLKLRIMCCCKNMYTTTTTSKHHLSKVRVPIYDVDVGRTSRQWLFRSDIGIFTIMTQKNTNNNTKQYLSLVQGWGPRIWSWRWKIFLAVALQEDLIRNHYFRLIRLCHKYVNFASHQTINHWGMGFIWKQDVIVQGDIFNIPLPYNFVCNGDCSLGWYKCKLWTKCDWEKTWLVALSQEGNLS